MDLVAVVVAALANFVFGFIWYSEPVLGKIWMKLSGVKKMKPNPMYMATGLLSSLVMAYVLSMILDFMNALTLVDGLFGAFTLWLGFIATVTLGSVLWEGKSPKLYLLNNAYNLIGLLIMGAILMSM